MGACNYCQNVFENDNDLENHIEITHYKPLDNAAIVTHVEIKPSNEGVKFDQGKSRLDLIPYEALDGLGQVLAYGAKKYAEANWAKGINYSRLIAAALRHLNQFNAGVDTDEESGLSHIHHALCNLAFLAYMKENREDLDDRWVKKVK